MSFGKIKPKHQKINIKINGDKIMTEHIVYLYDEDIKKIIANQYNVDIKNVEDNYFYDMLNAKTQICYKITFPRGE